MSRKQKQRRDDRVRKLKKSTLIIGLTVGLLFSVTIGVAGGAMGLGSLYPQLNLIAKPVVCPLGEMSYSQNVSTIGTANYYTAKWFCADLRSGERTEIDPNSIFLSSGLVFGLAFFAILLLVTYLYWNSSIGPAKNDGPLLW